MIRSLLYIPSMNMEKYPGAPRTPLSVSLYCRKVRVALQRTCSSTHQGGLGADLQQAG